MSADPVNQEAEIEETVSNVELNNLTADEKKLITDLHCQWLKKHDILRQKALEDHEKKLRNKYMEDKEQLNVLLQAQFQEELDQTRAEITELNKTVIEEECSALAEKYRKELFQAKKMQWCTHCSKAASYHCCWNTAYCSTDCQRSHWQEHKMSCCHESLRGSTAEMDQPFSLERIPNL